DRRARQKAEIARRSLDVGEGLRHVAGLERREFHPRLTVASALDYLDEVHERLAAVIAEVVQAMPRLTVAVRWRPVERRHDAGDDIVDVGEVAPHVAIVEDLDGLAAQDRPGKEECRHVWPAPRPVDREEPQTRERQAVEMAVVEGHQLARPL